jgi:hypothetical protein
MHKWTGGPEDHQSGNEWIALEATTAPEPFHLHLSGSLDNR